jgi:cation diffusion facilitator family transporter
VAYKWIHGLSIESLGAGTLIVAGAALLNGALGWYLIRVGRRTHSLILEANGKHVLTDFWTSLGVIGGLVLVLVTGWLPFDPLIAIAVALNILWSGGQLVSRSVGGLMDYANPQMTAAIAVHIDALCRDLQLQRHGLRVRHTGFRILIEVHLLFPFGITLGEAHRRATVLEDRVAAGLDREAEVVTHLEALEDHATVHGRQH